MWWLLIFIAGIILFSLLIDWRRKKNNNNSHISINPNGKPGESSNYLMGDNKDTGGFQ
ncbi:hypothetical protein [Cytobacillus firmus]|uniref:hypothetical protein n=1 Tax=Cytobacillus firmus TaxID=1399 RepID=UPI00190F7EBB|nr:hypothetical protein [Cytobacillus firmus]